MIEQLKEQIKVVVAARQRAQLSKDARALSWIEWETQNRELIEEGAASVQLVSEAETKLRELTLQAYAETGNKSPAVGVGIRVKTVLSYLASEAMDWAMEHKLALKLDPSAFEKIAKTSNLPFVTISEEPQATIATQLEVE